MRVFSIQGFPSFNKPIDIVLAFEIGYDIAILKMTNFDVVDPLIYSLYGFE